MSGQGGKPTGAWEAWAEPGSGKLRAHVRKQQRGGVVSEVPQGCRRVGWRRALQSPEEDGQCVPLANQGRALGGWTRRGSRGQAQSTLVLSSCVQEGLRQAETSLGHLLCRALLISSQGSYAVEGLGLGLPELALLSPSHCARQCQALQHRPAGPSGGEAALKSCSAPPRPMACPQIQ